jgi:hypothetical protein
MDAGGMRLGVLCGEFAIVLNFEYEYSRTGDIQRGTVHMM